VYVCVVCVSCVFHNIIASAIPQQKYILKINIKILLKYIKYINMANIKCILNENFKVII